MAEDAHPMKLTHKTTLADAKRLAEECERRGGILVYASRTPWWLILADPAGDLPYRIPAPKGELIPTRYRGLPCDPRGSVLFQTEKATEFIAAAEGDPDHYGEHGLDTFMAAYHGNVTTDDGRPTSLDGWPVYSALIDMESSDA